MSDLHCKAYIARLMVNLHCKSWMLVEAWRCTYFALTIVLVFVLTMACLNDTGRNLGCGVG
jgi:hypothetical protein